MNDIEFFKINNVNVVSDDVFFADKDKDLVSVTLQVGDGVAEQMEVGGVAQLEKYFHGMNYLLSPYQRPTNSYHGRSW